MGGDTNTEYLIPFKCNSYFDLLVLELAKKCGIRVSENYMVFLAAVIAR